MIIKYYLDNLICQKKCGIIIANMRNYNLKYRIIEKRAIYKEKIIEFQIYMTYKK
jgi:hypothetical protein